PVELGHGGVGRGHRWIRAVRHVGSGGAAGAEDGAAAGLGMGARRRRGLRRRVLDRGSKGSRRKKTRGGGGEEWLIESWCCLASPEALFVTGEGLHVEGGWVFGP